MRLIAFLSLLAMSLTIAAADYDQDKPFGYCTRTSRTDAASIYQMYGGGCYTYPIPKDFAGKVERRFRTLLRTAKIASSSLMVLMAIL